MKSHILEATKNPRLFRIVGRQGDWQNYFLQNENPKDEWDGIVLKAVNSILDTGYTKGFGFDQFLLSNTEFERDAILEAAGKKGDRIHKFIEGMLARPVRDPQDGPVPANDIWKREDGVYNKTTKEYDKIEDDEWVGIIAFTHFWADHECKLIEAELPLYNVSFGYAGTADALIVIGKECGGKYCTACRGHVGKVGLWDWKSSSGIRASYFSQLEAYACAENLPGYLPGLPSIPPLEPGQFASAVEYTAILRFKASGTYESKALNTENRLLAMQRFCGAKAISDFEHKLFDPRKDIEDTPDNITILVERYVLPAVIATPTTIPAGMTTPEPASLPPAAVDAPVESPKQNEKHSSSRKAVRRTSEAQAGKPAAGRRGKANGPASRKVRGGR